MTKDETLKLALDALEGFIPYLPLKDEAQCNRYDKAITALRLAIDAQSMASKSTYKEQLETKDEPVAWMTENKYLITKDENLAKKIKEKGDEPIIPLYTTPQRIWVVLTDAEVFELFGRFTTMTGKSWLDLYRMAETKLKDKNNAT